MLLFKKKEDKEKAKKEKMPISAYPFAIQRRLKGYLTMIGVFVAASIILFIITRSFMSSLLGVIMAALIGMLYIMQKHQLDRDGFDIWLLRVVDHTYLTRLNRKPTGFYAEALNGPYRGAMCQISLASQSVAPPAGEVIELCVPGNLEASLLRDVYYIPQYYGLELVDDDFAVEEA